MKGRPSNGDVGTSEVKLRITDGVDSVERVYDVEVIDVNDAPRIEDKTVEFATEETMFNMSISIEDIDKSESVKAEDITVTDKPEWMSYEFREGELHLTGKPLEGVEDEVVTESVVIAVSYTHLTLPTICSV